MQKLERRFLSLVETNKAMCCYGQKEQSVVKHPRQLISKSQPMTPTLTDVSGILQKLNYTKKYISLCGNTYF
jgi:hypothetical protein